jgi:hypothetical protein
MLDTVSHLHAEFSLNNNSNKNLDLIIICFMEELALLFQIRLCLILFQLRKILTLFKKVEKLLLYNSLIFSSKINKCREHLLIKISDKCKDNKIFKKCKIHLFML